MTVPDTEGPGVTGFAPGAGGFAGAGAAPGCCCLLTRLAIPGPRTGAPPAGGGGGGGLEFGDFAAGGASSWAALLFGGGGGGINSSGMSSGPASN